MKNYFENSIKRYLKRKVRITLGIIVGILITGGVVYSNDTEASLDTTNNIMIDYTSSSGNKLEDNINITVSKENTNILESERKNISTNEKQWRIIINRTHLPEEGIQNETQDGIYQTYNGVLTQGSNHVVDESGVINVDTNNNVTVNFNGLGGYLRTQITQKEIDEYDSAKENLKNQADIDNYLSIKQNFIDKVLTAMGNIVLQNNGDLINNSDKTEECNIHSYVPQGSNYATAITGVVVNKGNITTTGKTNIGAENHVAGGDAIISPIINDGKIELWTNSNIAGGRSNIYANTTASGNSLVGYIENNGILNSIKGNQIDYNNLLTTGNFNILSYSQGGDSSIVYLTNNGLMINADVNIANVNDKIPDEVSVSRISQVTNNGIMIGETNIYNRNHGMGLTQIDSILNRGGMFATRYAISNDNIAAFGEKIELSNVLNYGTIETFPMLNTDGTEENSYSTFSNSFRNDTNIETGAKVGKSIISNFYNYGKVKSSGDVFYLGAQNFNIGDIDTTGILNRGTVIGVKENIIHFEVANNSEGNIDLRNFGSLVAEKSMIWSSSYSKNLVSDYSGAIYNNGVLGAKRIFMSNNSENKDNQTLIGIQTTEEKDRKSNNNINLTGNGLYVIVDNQGYINNAFTVNNDSEVELTGKVAYQNPNDRKYDYYNITKKYTVLNTKIEKNISEAAYNRIKNSYNNIGQYLFKSSNSSNYHLIAGIEKLFEADIPISSNNKSEIDNAAFKTLVKDLLDNSSTTIDSDLKDFLSKVENGTITGQNFYDLFANKADNSGNPNANSLQESLTHSISIKSSELTPNTGYILNGIDNTLSVDSSTDIKNSIINAYETAIKFDGENSLTLSGTTVNGGIKIGEKNTDGTSIGKGGNGSDLVVAPYIIVGDENANTLVLNGTTNESGKIDESGEYVSENMELSTIINGGIALGGGSDTLTIDGYNIYINGVIDADANEDETKSTSTNDKDTLNINGKLNIINDVYGFEETNISGDVTIYGRVPDGSYGEIDRHLTFNGGDITIQDGGKLTLRIDTTGQKTGDIIENHALFNNEGVLTIEKGGKLNLGVTGLGWQTVINLGKTTIAQDTSAVGDTDIDYGDVVDSVTGDIGTTGGSIKDKEYFGIDTTSVLHTIRRMTTEEVALLSDNSRLYSLNSADKKGATELSDSYLIVDAKQDLDPTINIVTPDEPDSPETGTEDNKNCIKVEDYLGNGNVKYEQLNKIYHDILNSGSLDKFTVVGDTAEEKTQSYMEFLNYLQEVYTETPYSFTSELSRKSLRTFRNTTIDFPFKANEDDWLIYGGLTHVDGGTKDTYYGKGYYSPFDVNTATDVKADMRTTGAYALAEYGNTAELSTGIVVGGAKNKLNLTNGSNSDGSMAYIGTYAKYDKGNWRGIIGAGVQWGDYDSERATQRRRVCDLVEQDENYKAHHHDRAFDIFAKGVYSYELKENLFLEPFVAGSYTWAKQYSIHEEDRALALDIDEKRFKYAEVEAGVELKKVIPHDDGKSNIKFGVSYSYLLEGYEDEYLHGKYQKMGPGPNEQKGFDMLVPEKNRGSIEVSLKYELEKDSGWLFDAKGSYIFDTADYHNIKANSQSKNYRDGEWMIGVGIGYKFNSLKDFSLVNLFDFDKSEIKPEGREQILAYSEALNKRSSGGELKIEGHTDYKGSEAYNQALSERRAKAVETEFRKNVTNEKIRYEVVGYGELRPVADNATDEGRALNRRVEVKYRRDE